MHCIQALAGKHPRWLEECTGPSRSRRRATNDQGGINSRDAAVLAGLKNAGQDRKSHRRLIEVLPEFLSPNEDRTNQMLALQGLSSIPLDTPGLVESLNHSTFGVGNSAMVSALHEKLVGVGQLRGKQRRSRSQGVTEELSKLLKVLEFDLSTPTIDWSLYIGVDDLGVEIAVKAENRIAFESELTYSRFVVNVEDGAHLTANIRLLGLGEIPISKAWVCFKGYVEFDFRIVEKTATRIDETLQKFVNAYDLVRGDLANTVGEVRLTPGRNPVRSTQELSSC